MKISLISPYPDFTSFGIRTISATLKQAGHQSRLIFLSDPCKDVFGANRYKEPILGSILHACEGSDIIGITLMTNYFEDAVKITKAIKRKMNTPVIWGGIHPTIRPEEALQYADMVCIGEGEESTLELLTKMQHHEPYWDVKGYWFKRDGAIIRNNQRVLIHDLDVYPMPDYSLEGHYALFKAKICEMSSEIMEYCFETNNVSSIFGKVIYQTLTGRGCPHQCAYCSNDFLKGLYEGQAFLRWRSVRHILSELQWIKDKFPYIEAILFSDDCFFARSMKNLEEFAHGYKEKIGLPFLCLGSPLTVTEDKLALLVDAGLIHIQMGIESGSRNLREIFNRGVFSNERILKVIQSINKYKKKMIPPHYDFILDSPYETTQDKIESLKIISKIPRPFRLQTFSMVLYPGTKLYQMAKKDGLIKDEKKEIYDRSYVTQKNRGYLNLLFSLAKGGRLPSWLLSLLIRQPIVSILSSRILNPFFQYFNSILIVFYHSVIWFFRLGKKK